MKLDEMLNLDGLKQALEGVGSQISTAINIEKVTQRIRSRNILHNWYFKRPINQRKVSGTVTDKGYFIDRWKLIDGEVTLTDDGLVLNGVIQQPLEFPIGQSVVATVLTENGLLPSENIEFDDEQQIFQITANGETLIAAKLEVGDHQTLVRKISENALELNDVFEYTSELMLCYRYLQPVSVNGVREAYIPQLHASIECIMVVPMRSIPIVISGLVSYSIDIAGGHKTAEDFIISRNTTRMVMFRVGLPSDFKYGELEPFVRLFSKNTKQEYEDLLLSAEL